jgi:hypothetical protein
VLPDEEIEMSNYTDRQKGAMDFYGFSFGTREIPPKINITEYCSGLVDRYNDDPDGMEYVKDWMVENGFCSESFDGKLV